MKKTLKKITSVVLALGFLLPNISVLSLAEEKKPRVEYHAVAIKAYIEGYIPAPGYTTSASKVMRGDNLQYNGNPPLDAFGNPVDVVIISDLPAPEEFYEAEVMTYEEFLSEGGSTYKLKTKPKDWSNNLYLRFIDGKNKSFKGIPRDITSEPYKYSGKIAFNATIYPPDRKTFDSINMLHTVPKSRTEYTDYFTITTILKVTYPNRPPDVPDEPTPPDKPEDPPPPPPLPDREVDVSVHANQIEQNYKDFDNNVPVSVPLLVRATTSRNWNEINFRLLEYLWFGTKPTEPREQLIVLENKYFDVENDYPTIRKTAQLEPKSVEPFFGIPRDKSTQTLNVYSQALFVSNDNSFQEHVKDSSEIWYKITNKKPEALFTHKSNGVEKGVYRLGDTIEIEGLSTDFEDDITFIEYLIEDKETNIKSSVRVYPKNILFKTHVDKNENFVVKGFTDKKKGSFILDFKNKKHSSLISTMFLK